MAEIADYSSDATFHGLHCWYKHMFEKLGWMVLVKTKDPSSKKPTEYKEHVEMLHEKLKQKLAHIKNEDNKDDLKIMIANVEILLKHIDEDFFKGQQGGKRKVSRKAPGRKGSRKGSRK